MTGRAEDGTKRGTKKGPTEIGLTVLERMAGTTGLEPAASAVTEYSACRTGVCLGWQEQRERQAFMRVSHDAR